jgi:hypothetical protein
MTREVNRTKYLLIRCLQFFWFGACLLGFSIMDDAYWNFASRGDVFYSFPTFAVPVWQAEMFGWLVAFISLFGLAFSFILEVSKKWLNS